MADFNAIPEIRNMQFNDLPAVLKIEQQVVADPWTLRLFEDCLNQTYSCWVLEINAPEKPEIIGYALMSQQADEAHILNIVIQTEYQFKGHGTRLFKHLLEIAEKNWYVYQVILEVNISNEPAIDLYQDCGFKKIGTRKAYYWTPNGRVDAWTMALKFDYGHALNSETYRHNPAKPMQK